MRDNLIYIKMIRPNSNEITWATYDLDNHEVVDTDVNIYYCEHCELTQESYHPDGAVCQCNNDMVKME